VNITPTLTQYLEETKIPLRLSCLSPSGWPVVLSLWFLFENGKLYCATQKSAKTVEYLSQNPKCAFEIASDLPPYCGIRGQGLVKLNPDIGPKILKRVIIRYLGSTTTPLAKRLLAKRQHEVAIEITPINLYKWNYSPRMKDSVPTTAKPCP
jgi:hypothetical protein